MKPKDWTEVYDLLDEAKAMIARAETHIKLGRRYRAINPVFDARMALGKAQQLIQTAYEKPADTARPARRW